MFSLFRVTLLSAYLAVNWLGMAKQGVVPGHGEFCCFAMYLGSLGFLGSIGWKLVESDGERCGCTCCFGHT
jgi:hypothetical protein